MSCTSVTHNKWPNNTEWEEMRPIITDIWVNRARNRKDLVNILRGEHSFMATEKTCYTRIKKWGLSTYKTRTAPSISSPNGPSQPVRKRKRPPVAPEPRPRPLPLVPSPASKQLLRPNIYLPQELMLYSISHYVAGVFGSSIQRFTTVRDLWRPKVPSTSTSYGGNGLLWERIADLYWTAENKYRAEPDVKKLKKGLEKAHQELKHLVHRGNLEENLRRLFAKVPNLTPEAKQRFIRASKLSSDPWHCDPWHHVFITSFWRVCYRLLRIDLVSPHEFSFVSDFLFELEKLLFLHPEYGKRHSLRELAFALCQVEKKDMKHTLECGALRTICEMGPGVEKKTIVMKYWTAFLWEAK